MTTNSIRVSSYLSTSSRHFLFSSHKSNVQSATCILNSEPKLQQLSQYQCRLYNNISFKTFQKTELYMNLPQSSISTSSSSTSHNNNDEVVDITNQAIHRSEGLCAVYKPIEWTSNDVVAYIRGMLERDARERGVLQRSNRRSKKNKIKIGHGGTLDPLAEGVLVLGIGEGTKKLQDYLKGTKRYEANFQLGYETTTLDLEGNVTKTAPYDHVTEESIQNILPKFTGSILQFPPIYSAIKLNGKKLYEEAREGKTIEELGIEAREIEVYNLAVKQLLNESQECKKLLDAPETDYLTVPSCYSLDVECGGGTYVRSLIRDLGYELNSLATMTKLVRVKQGPFSVSDTLVKDDWSADAIYAAIDKSNLLFCDDVENNDHTDKNST
jgi:tRNA pseudouridine55 synthase